MKLVLATRSSPLARWQAEAVRAALLVLHPRAEVRLLDVRSRGDQDAESDLASLEGVGFFTAEVDRAVAEGRADVAVHSLKDLTTEPEGEVALAGVLARGPAEDVLVGARLSELPSGARVATGSARRRALLLASRPDLEVVSIRGNVETRLAKLDAGAADALMLARAGLERLGLGDRVAEVLDRERFVPAVGQGLVACTARAGDEATRRTLAAVSDGEGWYAALAERAFLRGVAGGCNAPVGAHARVRESALALHARVLATDGSRTVEGRVSGTVERAEELGERLARDLVSRGAAELLEAARA